MAHAAITQGAKSYLREHYIIRARLYSGLTRGNMAIRSLFEDEKVKLSAPKACCYCGSSNFLSLDHLVPSSRGGGDTGDNLVWACRSCNSSKNQTDLLEWYTRRDIFPPLLLLRRYFKLFSGYCDQNNLFTTLLDEPTLHEIPFRLDLFPRKYPTPDKLQLWIPQKTPE